MKKAVLVSAALAGILGAATSPALATEKKAASEKKKAGKYKCEGGNTCANANGGTNSCAGKGIAWTKNEAECKSLKDKHAAHSGAGATDATTAPAGGAAPAAAPAH